ncbi:hypothetical protein ACFO3I_14385 [Rheinheimera marina]|uniref:Flagellar protein FlgN n=1 Tax=Rheinheimera marina TaxID=1774958 RepID=A0ABV9JPS8_9GAMM
MLIEPQEMMNSLKQLSAPAAEKAILLDWLKSACLLQAQTAGEVVSAQLLEQLRQQFEPVFLCLARQDLLPENRQLCQQLEQQISAFYQGIASVPGHSQEQLLRRWNHSAAAAGTGQHAETFALNPSQSIGHSSPAITQPTVAVQVDAGYSRYE